MAVTFVGAGALGNNATVPTQAIVAHASTAVGDILLAQIINKSVTANAVSPPDGTWTAVIATEVNDCTTATNDHQFTLFWKRATASGATSFTFTKATDDNVLFGGVISSWRGCLASGSPIDATAAARTKTPGANDLVTFPAFDPTLPSHVVYMAYYGLSTVAFAAAMSNDVNPDCTTRYNITPFGCTSGDSDGSAIASRTWASGSVTDAGSTGVVFALTPEPLACLANDVESDPTVSNPAAAQIGGPAALLANDVLSASSVTQPAVKALHGLLANDVLSASSITQPSQLKQLHGLLANDVISTSSVTKPIIGLMGVLVKPFAEDVVSTPVVSKPSQLKQLQVILANDVKSASDERLVAPATNGFYPAAFYGRAFDHSPIINTFAITDTADVLASQVVTNFGLLANDVISTSDVPTPVAAITRVCLANDVISTSDVPTPTAVITRVALANDVLSPSSVTKPTQLRQLHGLLANDALSPSSVTNPVALINRAALANDVLSPSSVTKPTLQSRQALLANDVISTSDVPTPALGQLRVLLANDVVSNSSVTQPVATIRRDVLANDVISASSLTRPATSSRWTLFAENVESPSKVTQPSQLRQLQGILANDVKSTSDERLVAPATNGFYPAAFYGKAFDHSPATNVLAATDTIDVLAAVTIGRFDVLANDVNSNSSVSQPAAAVIRVCLANDVKSTSKVTNPIVGILGIIDARDLTSTSSVSQPSMLRQQALFADDVISASSVSRPSQLKQLQALLANDVKSTPFVRLVAPATNGFYPLAFYGKAFDHLPAANVLAAAETADVLASVVVTNFGLNANDIVSGSSVSQPSLLQPQMLLANDVQSPSKVTQPSQLHQLQLIAASDVISTPFLRLVAPATNGFYPAAFYGVAFDHLPATNVLAAADTADTLASVALTAVEAFSRGPVSVPHVSQPSQLKQLEAINANNIVSTPFVRLVAPATNGFYPAAFYGVAFDHLPAANVLAAIETTDVLDVVAFTSGAGTARDVISASSVSKPSLHLRQTLLANDVISRPSVLLVEGATNGFNPAAFYGVAFDHLPASNVLAATDIADTSALVAMAAIRAFANDVISTPFTLLVKPATNGFYPAAFYGVAFDHLPATNVLAATDTIDVMSGAEGSLVTEIAAELLDEPDVVSFDAVTLDILYIDLDTFDEPDTYVGKVGRWDFSYGEDEGIRVAWEKQVVAVWPKAPEDGDVPTVDTLVGFYGSAFDQYGFFSGSSGFTYDATDTDLIHVAWEKQELVALGRPRAPPRVKPPVVIPPPVTAGFEVYGFYGLGFFTFAEPEDVPVTAQGYDDDEAIVVPPSYVIERLRETSTSYVAPRRKV